MKWVALFSQTGSEVFTLSKLLRMPDLILTNNMEYDGPLDVHKHKKAADLYEELMQYVEEQQDGTLITLHGWLRIIPSNVLCRLPVVYNGHPAPITLYPDLKGMDPQMRLVAGLRDRRYTHIGTAIHEVSDGVDEGSIMLTNQERYSGGPCSVEQRLRCMSLDLWKTFLEVKLNG